MASKCKSSKEKPENTEGDEPTATSCCPHKSDWPEPGDQHGSSLIRIVDSAAIEAAAANFIRCMADREVRERAKLAIERLRERGEYRSLNVFPTDWRSKFDALIRRFPNFRPAVEYICGFCAVFEIERRAAPIPPILLNGPPGIGKTFFAEELAKILGTPCTRVGFDTAQGNSALVGSSDYWSNTQPGAIYEALVNGDYANPIVLVDEIDKVTVDYHNPLNASASRTTDCKTIP